MSKPIEGVSEKIETCAKKEFLDKGYHESDYFSKIISYITALLSNDTSS